jgi:hypothetical protein
MTYELDDSKKARIARKIRDLLEQAKSLMRSGEELTKQLKAAVLAGISLNLQRARDLMNDWMIYPRDLADWQQDTEIMQHHALIIRGI